MNIFLRVYFAVKVREYTNGSFETTEALKEVINLFLSEMVQDIVFNPGRIPLSVGVYKTLK